MSLAGLVVNDRLQVEFPRRLDTTHELTYTLQASPDLTAWSAFAATPLDSVPDSTPGFETARYASAAALPAQSPLFVRLKIGWQ